MTSTPTWPITRRAASGARGWDNQLWRLGDDLAVRAFAAGAEAQLTGRLGACAGSCGPGHLHLINGLFDAQRSMAPVLALAAHIPSAEIGTSFFQETHPHRLFAECSHYSELISHPAQMPRILQTAIQHAIGRSGVAVVSMSGDIAVQDAPQRTVEPALLTRRPVVRPGEAEIAELARLVDEAEKITLFCGSGTAGSHEEVMAFAERVKAPVGHALRGKEWIQYDNRNWPASPPPPASSCSAAAAAA
ncbi:thiamine pyrophosphate-binding protein [Nonomuraea sp. KM90]|uniref:thiamine pyrophosphate-binding protein n=1 Tax=Nonomuraea sp. KM90 TaxID=3457428 RepID=UPI003FCE483E